MHAALKGNPIILKTGILRKGTIKSHQFAVKSSRWHQLNWLDVLVSRQCAACTWRTLSNIKESLFFEDNRPIRRFHKSGSTCYQFAPSKNYFLVLAELSSAHWHKLFLLEGCLWLQTRYDRKKKSSGEEFSGWTSNSCALIVHLFSFCDDNHCDPQQQRNF